MFGDKMSTGKKFLVAGAAAGGAGYLAWRKVWSHFYPPSFKKYIAVAALAFTFYSVRNCSEVKAEFGNIYHGTKQAFERRVDRSDQIQELEKRIEELTTINKEYSSIYGEIKKPFKKNYSSDNLKK